MSSIRSTVEWQMQRFNLSREEAEEKLRSIKEKKSLSNKLKLDVEWQMHTYNLTREEAEEKIKKLRQRYGSARPKSVEWQMQHFGLTREEAEEKVKTINKLISENVSKSRLEHPEKNNSRKEYWLAKGYSEEEALDKVKNKMQRMRDSYSKIIEKEPDKYRDRHNTCIEYYLSKGLSEEDAIKALKERQNTFTLEKCIKKYGEEAGRKVYEERQIRWSKKMHEKYIKGEYSKMPKSFNSSCYSKVEKEFVEELESVFADKEKLRTYKTIQQSFRNDDGKIYFSDVCYKNKIIELFGDYWHCNPKIYKKEYFHKIINSSAEEIWEKDSKKIEYIQSKGYDVLVIWEKEFRENKETTIQKAIQFLNEAKNEI